MEFKKSEKDFGEEDRKRERKLKARNKREEEEKFERWE